MAVVLSDPYTRTTPIRIFTFFFFYAFEQSSADTARRQRDGVLILSCFSSDARFTYDFFASIGGFRRGGTLLSHFLRTTHFRCCCCCCCCCVEKARLKLVWACRTALDVGTKYILSFSVFFQIYYVGGYGIRL